MVFGGWHEVNTPPDLTRLVREITDFKKPANLGQFIAGRASNDTALFLSEEDTVTQVKVQCPACSMPCVRRAPSGHGRLPPQ